ncbi:GATA transcription factor 8 [Rhodamnia argentea]|uniref:GATA transcription factor n=1 Tax=Rhodamnia argentea TaxID=178133 RepID=A0A8B8QRH5_9MYRT|nr:GATA transcription factor 8 [Rhodamnia argentea]
MTGPNFIDEIDCGSFFDHIDDLLDFPNEDIEAGLPVGKPDSLPSIWSAQPESLPGSDSVFSANSSSSLSAELSVPYEDIVQLEWLSTFVEDSFSGGSLTMSKDQISNSNSRSSSNKDSSQQFQTSSPVSVLESSSSCSAENKPEPPPRSPEAANPARCGRARSKRPRPATFNPRPAIQLAPQQSSDIAENEPSDGNCEESVYPLVVKVPKKQADGAEPKKKKKIKFTMPTAPPAEADQGLPSMQQAVRKCLHCEITKTPQWRAGPLGPKTLCNACGVRYKSGRLFPEYRPAASPTFIPSLHSNSHKKVLEMRNKPTDEADATGTASAVTNSLELIPNMSHRLDYM